MREQDRRGDTFNPHTTDVPIPIENVFVDVFRVDRVLEVGFYNEAAEIDLPNRKLDFFAPTETGNRALTPGSTVMILPAGNLPLTRRYLNMGSLSS